MNSSLLVIIAAILWGTSGLFIKWLALPIVVMAFFRSSVPVISLSLWFAIKRQNPFHGKWGYMAVCGLITAARMACFFIGFTMADISTAVLILYTYPIWTTLLSALILKERISSRHWGLLALSFLGICLIFSTHEINFQAGQFVGLSAMLISAILHALFVVLVKRWSADYSPLETVFYQNLLPSIIFTTLATHLIADVSAVKVAAASLFSFIAGLVAFALFFQGLKKLSASKAALLSYCEALSTIILGIIVLNETFSTNTIIGATMIIGSAVTMLRSRTSP